MERKVIVDSATSSVTSGTDMTRVPLNGITSLRIDFEEARTSVKANIGRGMEVTLFEGEGQNPEAALAALASLMGREGKKDPQYPNATIF